MVPGYQIASRWPYKTITMVINLSFEDIQGIASPFY
jgi:hypothetical protein